MGSTYLDRVDNKTLGQMLTEKGVVNQAQLEEALDVARQNGIRLGEALISLGYIGGDALSYAIAEQYGQRPMELHPSMVDNNLIKRFDPELLWRYTMLPLIELNNELVVVVADPNDQAGLAELARQCPDKTVTPQLGAAAQIRRCLRAALPLPTMSGAADTGVRPGVAAAPQAPPAPAAAQPPQPAPAAPATPAAAPATSDSDFLPGVDISAAETLIERRRPASAGKMDLSQHKEIPAPASPDFDVAILSLAARNWGQDVLLREIDGGLRVDLMPEALPLGESAADGGRLLNHGSFKGAELTPAFQQLVQYTTAVPHTGGQAWMTTTPAHIGEHSYRFLILRPATTGPAFCRVRALLEQSENYEKEQADLALATPGKFLLVDHDRFRAPDYLVTQMAAQHAPDHVVIVFSSALKTVLPGVAVYPWPYTNAIAALQSHGATAVFFDFVPPAETIAEISAAVRPVPRFAVISCGDDSRAFSLLAQSQGNRRVTLSRMDATIPANSAGFMQKFFRGDNA